MQKIEAIIRPEKLTAVKDALAEVGVCGLNVVRVTGRGAQKGLANSGRGEESYVIDMLPKVKLEIVVRDAQVDTVIDTICDAAHTGNIGDGKIMVSPVTEAIRVRTRERGEAAL